MNPGAAEQLDSTDELTQTAIHDTQYEYRFWVYPDEDGMYVAESANLNGVFAQGDSLADAVENMRDAFDNVRDDYRQKGEPIPWKEKPIEYRPANAIDKWIVVDVR